MEEAPAEAEGTREEDAGGVDDVSLPPPPPSAFLRLMIPNSPIKAPLAAAGELDLLPAIAALGDVVKQLPVAPARGLLAATRLLWCLLPLLDVPLKAALLAGAHTCTVRRVAVAAAMGLRQTTPATGISRCRRPLVVRSCTRAAGVAAACMPTLALKQVQAQVGCTAKRV